ncbi:hypothetical protein OFL77_27555, partial [Escherichia coli]|uniref:hypothetical protein n=1 Tax=Escherichia coli TaxID=562 RepID=UPI0021E00C61
RASERVAYLKSILPGVSQELRDALQSSYAALKVQADAEANARLAGEVDVGATTNGKVAVRPPVDLGAAPGPVSSRPERQTST